MATFWGTTGDDYIVAAADDPLSPQDHVYDYLYGGPGNDTLGGGLGADYMDGGDGFDRYFVDDVGDKVVDSLSDSLGGDWIGTSVSYTLPASVDNLHMYEGALNGTGNANNNQLFGSNDSNILNGKGGADYMEGNHGNDTYYVDNVGDSVWEFSSDPSDKVFSTISYILPEDIEHLTLQGSANINASGNYLNNTLVGNSGRNILTGALGANTLDGAGGDDFFDFNSLDASNGATRDRIVNFQFGTSTTGDRIDVTWFDANFAVAGNQAFKWGATTTKSNGYLWAENSANGDTIIKGNIDADAEAEFQVAVADGTRLANAWIAADFLL